MIPVRLMTSTALGTIGVLACASAATAQSAPAVDPQPTTVVDVTGYYLMTDFGGDAAFGAITPITGAGIDAESQSVSQRLTDPDGGGVRASFRRDFGASWFAAFDYSGFFTEESAAIGDGGVNTNRIQANLIDSTLASNLGQFPSFDEGLADFASESTDIEQHFGDLVVGRHFGGSGPLRGFWRTGVRVGSTDVERDIFYQDLLAPGDIDTARIDINSEMIGVGPTVGGGVTVDLTSGFALTASASASALYADFDLSRRDVHVDQSDAETGIREVSLDTQEIVPVFDASVEVKKSFGKFFASLGYTMSAWLGGSRSLTPNGFDDSDTDSTPYKVQSENIITHGVAARFGLLLGGPLSERNAPLLGDGPVNTTVDVTGYYLMTNFGGDPAFGTITPITGNQLISESNSVSQSLTNPEGGGVRISGRRLFSSSWFAGADYSGFFTDERSSIGNANLDNDFVHTSLLDRNLADNADLNDDFQQGEVDFASDRIEIEQHFGDLVLGQRLNEAGPVRGFWHTGVRIASIDVDRDIEYRNFEGAADLDTARIAIDSRMLGVGPTVGGGVTVDLTSGLALSASASASALYADFDLSRRDTYFNQTVGDTEIREVSLDTQDIVPVIDATVEIEKRFGSFFASLGYTMSAWLGGSRALTPNGHDDVDVDSTRYSVRSESIINHGLTARIGLLLGDPQSDLGSPLLADGPTSTSVDVTGYYLMTDFGGEAAFGAITPVTGAGVDPDSLSVSQRLTDPEGGGVRVALRRQVGAAWFAGADYAGFFTEERSSIGNSGINANGVYANLLDRGLADDVGSAVDFDDGIADFAAESIDIEQHFGDLIVGRQFDGRGAWRGYWKTGVRIASTEVDRQIDYQNLDGAVAANVETARIDINSEMLGAGPTVGGGVTLDLPLGLAVKAAAAASALYADFDLSRRDVYFNQRFNQSGIHEVSLNTRDIVPVFDTTVEVEKRFGNFFASLGYTMSAMLGGSKALTPNGHDDANNDTAAYTVRSENIITHGVSARLGVKFGGAE